jgi:hypothetical protein
MNRHPLVQCHADELSNIAAIGYAHKEHKLDYVNPVRFHDKSAPRDRWLTRSEAARLLLATYCGEGPHVARFILVALYTWTRHNESLSFCWLPSIDCGWVDLKTDLSYRKGSREIESDKRRLTMPISPRLAAHLKRLELEGGAYIVNYGGLPLVRLKRAWHTARKAAGLRKEVTRTCYVTPFAMWAVQTGKPLELVAAALDDCAASWQALAIGKRSERISYQIR